MIDRYYCTEYSSHDHVLVDIKGNGIAYATSKQVNIPCPDCGRRMSKEYVGA